MSNNKQSSVEWLRSLYENRPAYEECILDEEWEQAKAMHKGEIKDAFYQGVDDESNEHGIMYLDMTEAETYYNETFGGKEL